MMLFLAGLALCLHSESMAGICLMIHAISRQRGFPHESGVYLVELEDGEHCVTPFQAERRWIEADGDWDNRTGWVCLTESRATVFAWADVPKATRT